MTTLVLVRHAQASPTPQAPERDWPLSDKGRQQALDLVPVLRELGVDALASSPFQRAVDTLRPYAGATGLEIAVDEDLRERTLGGWIEDLEVLNAAIARMHAEPDFALDGGETGRACLARYEAALARLVAANPGRTVAVGAHGGVIGHFLGARETDLPAEFWRRIRNPHVFLFEIADDYRWTGERTLLNDGLRWLNPAGS